MKTFHFDLRYGVAVKSPGTKPLFLLLGDKRYPITAHDENSLRSISNSVVADVLRADRAAVTHFCAVQVEEIPQHHVSMLQVVGSPEEGLNGLPPLYGLIYHVPERARRRHLKRKLKAAARRTMGLTTAAAHPHPKLASYLGSAPAALSLARQVDRAIEADTFITPWDTAVSLLFQHPELATNKPYTASVVQDHISGTASDPAQYNRVYELSLKISAQGPATPTGGWAIIKQATNDNDGSPMYAEFDLVAGDGSPVMTKDEPVMIYDLSQETETYAAAPVSYATRSVRNDPGLQNQSWSQPQGTVAQTTQLNAAETAAVHAARKATRAEMASSAVTFTVTEKTPHHGLAVYPGSLIYTPADYAFSIDVKNEYMRQLGSYVEFYADTDMKTPIANPEIPGDWPFYFPEVLVHELESDTQRAIGTVPAVNTIMGIPMPTDPTKLQVPWPQEAQAARLMFGGLGTSNWIMPVVWPGVILTGVFNYGLPLFFMAAGSAATNTKFYNDFVSNKDNIIAAAGVAFPIVSGGVATSAALLNTKKVLFSFASTFAGILVKKGMEKLSVYVMAKLVAAQAKNAIPVVGMAFRVASVALSVSQLAITTGECLSSPAVLEVDVLRQMEFDFTLHPDPKHGEPGRPETAVWPLVAETVEVVVTYRNGTSHVQTQTLPPTTSNTPLTFVFKPIGWGGQFKVCAHVYSKNGWLCGKYESDDMNAEPDDPATGVKTMEATIVELLVPLTGDTQYRYKQRLGYDAAKDQHAWEVGAISTKTESDLSCSNAGNNLCELVALTINQKAYQAGYVFRASGQNLPLEQPGPANSGQMYSIQNISVLSDQTLNERLKFSEVGLKVQPAISYDTFGQGPSEEEISPLNFILDSRDGRYHLRHVELMNFQHGFGLDDPQPKSWGEFLIPHLDEMVVHPSGFVIAVSYQAAKMQILRLPPAPLPDDQAPQAQIVSGQGILQGLMNGPVAMKVSVDGAIYVLEEINRRIQAFDLKGNPVPSFAGEHLFDMAASFAGDLDAEVFPDGMKAIFLENGVAHLFDFEDPALIPELDGGQLTMAVITAFSDQGLYLTYNETDGGKVDPAGSSTVTVLQPGAKWRLFDPNKNFTYEVVNQDGALSVSDVLNNVTVSVVGRGVKWVVADMAGARSYLLTIDPATPSVITTREYLSYFSLHGQENTRYLDLALEAKGYIYILSYDNPGTDRIPHTAYAVDIYTPEGEFLVRTPDPKLYQNPEAMQYVAAARLALDPFRNMFALDYSSFQGPGGRTEPGVSSWTPTTPLFDEDPDQRSLFLENDIDGLVAMFATHGVTISPTSTVEIVNPEGDYLLHSDGLSYDAILSLNTSGEQRLFVYDILA